jgi:hypothetical protein
MFNLPRRQSRRLLARLLGALVGLALLALAAHAPAAEPQVVALANQLGNSPAAMFAHVRDQVGIDVYGGALRGARGTLASGAGNALDRATLLIELLRAAGFTARYANGTLGDADTRRLVARSFPGIRRALGCTNDGPRSDPPNDATLYNEAQNHYWVEYKATPAAPFAALDPSFPESVAGTRFATPTQQFDTVPEALKHKVRFRVNAETFSQAGAVYGFGLGTNTVLDQTYAAADLVDRAVSFGHLVTSSTPPGLAITATSRVYTPYLTIGNSAIDPRNYVVVHGTDYSELITNYPLGSTLVTGVFVDIDVIDPADPTAPRRVQRALVDRIGYGKRQQGGSISIDPASLAAAALSAMDVVTVQVNPSAQPLDDFTARKSRLQALQGEAAALQPAVDALPPPAAQTAADLALANRAITLNRAIAVAVLELLTAAHEGAASRMVGDLGTAYLVKPWIASPRLAIAHARVEGSTLTLGLDIAKNDLRAYPLPGIAWTNRRSFEQARGVTESVLEGEIFNAVTGLQTRNLTTVFGAPIDPAQFTVVTPYNQADVDALSLSADAKARIRDALALNRIVLTPDAPALVDGKPYAIWLESDPATGYTISTGEDGTHQAIVDYAFLVYDAANSSQNSVTAGFIGKMGGFGIVGIGFTAAVLETLATGQPFQQMSDRTKEILRSKVAKYVKFQLEWFNRLKIGKCKGPCGLVQSYVKGLISGIATFSDALKIGDPPAPPILLAPPVPPLPASVAPGATPGVSVTLAPDARFNIPFQGSELPTLYTATIRNTGPATDTFRLVGNGSDFPYALAAVAPPLTLGPGAAGEVSVCLLPEGPLPAAGSSKAFSVVAQSTTNGAVAQTANGAYVAPAAKALLLKTLPAVITTTAPGTTTTTLTLDSLGNAATTVNLSAVTSPQLTLSGLPASVSLAPGESRSLPLSLAVAAGTSSSATLAAIITGDFGGAAPVEAQIGIDVVSAATACTAGASLAAFDIARDGMGGGLARLAPAIDDLLASPADDTRRQSVLLELDNLANSQFNAPYLTPFVAPVAAHRAALAAASPAAIAGLLGQLEATMCTLRTALRAAATDDIQVAVLPGVATNIPTQATTVAVNIYNDTALPRVFDVAVSGVPAGVAAVFNTAVITVPAYYHTNGFQSPELNLQFTNTDGNARAFAYQVTATPRDRPDVAKTVAGQLVLRPDLVRIVDLATNPRFADPGTPIAFTPKVMNSINTARTVAGFWGVRDDNNVVRASGPVPPVVLASGDSVVTAPPFNLDTTGLAAGTYTIEVFLYDTAVCCTEIPGARWTSAFIIGSPFSATLSAAPTVVPAGSSTVTMRLDLSHDTLPTPSILARSSLAIPAAARSIARSGAYLYVCQSDRVSIVDTANPDALSLVGSFATGLLGADYGSVGCNIAGNRLVLAWSGDTTSSFDEVKIVTFDIGGANASSPVQLNPAPVGLGKLFGGGIVFAGSTGYLPTSIVIYNPFSKFIFEQHGNLLALDFSTPSAPALIGELFRHFPAPSTDTNDPQYGGPNTIGGAIIAGNHALLASTTSTGGGVNVGVGRLLVVDRTQLPTQCAGDPNPCIVKTVDVAEARTLFGIARQGNTALAAGDSAGFYDGLSGLTGALTITAFDITDPANPVKRSTLVTPLQNRRAQDQCGQGLDAGGSQLVALANDFYAVGAFNPQSCAWVLALIDATDPLHLRVIPYDVSDTLATALLDGNRLYALTRTGIIVYDYAILAGPSITATVDLPKGTGVTVVPGSFSLAPTAVEASAADRDRYTWVQPSASSITWQENLTGMPFGGTRTVALGGAVGFTLPSLGSGTLSLNPVAVTSNQTLSIAPTGQYVGVAVPATYVLTFTNPTPTPVVYSLAVDGVSPAWVKSLPATVTVPANGQAGATLVLQTTLADDLGLDFAFTVTARSATASTLVQGILSIARFSRDVGFDRSEAVYATTVSAAPNPARAGRGTTARVTLTTRNTGNAPQSYAFVEALVPSGWSIGFDRGGVTVPADGTTDFVAAVTVPANTAPGSYDVGVDLYSGFFRVGRTTFKVDVSGAGVVVAVTPGSGTPATAFVATVTNTGTGSDTFDLSALGPLGGAVTLAQQTVTLNAGATQGVVITLGNTGYLPQGVTSFDVQAVSRGDGAVRSRATAQVTLGARQGLDLKATPAQAIVASTPTTRTFAVQLLNVGNVEDAYALRIKATSGATTATLRDAAGAGVQTLLPIRLPGLALGQFALDVTLASGTAGTVTLEAVSQTNGALVASTVVSLATGAAPAVTLAPPSLAFGNQNVGSTGATQMLTLTNSGSAPLTLGAVAVAGPHAGDFARSGTCTAALVVAPNGNCTVVLAFTPAAVGARSATVSVTSNAPGSPHTASLAGTGVSSALGLSVGASALAFGNQAVGSSSAAQTVTLTNTGGAALAIASITVTGANPTEFSRAGTCAAGPLASGASCTLDVSFTPTAAGARSAAVSIASDAPGSPHGIALTGTGVAATCFTGPLPGGGQATACFTGGGAACQFARAAFIPLAGAAASPPSGSAPPGYVFPFGLFDFATRGCTTGGAMNFTLTYPASLPAGTVYYKYGAPTSGAPPSWFALAATVSGNVVAFALPSGNIVDPGGPAYASPAVAEVIPVPALDAAALAMLAVLLALLGGFSIARKYPRL